MKRIDNFDRHIWTTFGLALGIAITAAAGWHFAVAWLIGYGLAWWLILALLTGRLVVRRKR